MKHYLAELKLKIHRIRLADEVLISTGNISEIMDLFLDNLGGTKYSLRLGPTRLAKGQSHRKMATQNHGSKAIKGQDSQVTEFV